MKNPISPISRRRSFTRRTVFALAGSIAALLGTAHAAPILWNPTTTDFNLGTNWQGNQPPGVGDIATFTGVFGTAPNTFQPILTADTSILGLNFSDTTTTGYNLTSPSFKLTLLSTDTGAAGALQSLGAGTNTIGAPLVLGATGAQTVTVGTGGTLLLSGAISGTGTLTSAGAGTLKLTGANTYSGGTTIAAGSVVHINSNTALGTGAVTLAGGTIDNSSGAAVTLTNNNPLTIGGSFTFAGSGGATGSLNLGSGAITLAAPATITSTAAAGQLTLGGIVGATSSSLSKDGAGTVVLSNTGTQLYTGATTVSAGTLEVDGILSSTAVTASGTGILRVFNVNALANSVVTGASSGGANLQLRNDTDGATFLMSGPLLITTGLTVNVDQATIGNTGKTLKLAAVSLTGAATFAATGGNGYNLSVGTVTVGGAAANTISPVSTNLTLGSLQGTASGLATVTSLAANSASFGGTITGVVADGDTANGKTLGIAKIGVGNWTLQGANTYTGTTTVTAGILQIDGSLAATAVTLNGGTLRASNATALSAITSLGVSTTASTLQLRSDTSATISSAPITIGANLAIDASQATAAGTNQTLSLTGPISQGAATIISTSTGGYTLALGAISTTAATAGLQVNTGALTVSSITGASLAAQTITLSGNTPGAGTVTGAIANGTSTIALTKSGTGTWTLLGSNSYSGVTTISAGTLNIQNSLALGTSAGGTVVAAGAALQLQGGITVAGETLSLASTSDTTPLVSVSGSNSWTGDITASVGGILRIQATAGTLTLGNIITTGANQLVFQGTATSSGSIVVNGAISGTAIVTHSSSSPFSLTLAGANTYTGVTNISNGSLTITGSLDPTTGSNVFIGSASQSGTLNLNAASAVTRGTVQVAPSSGTSIASTLTENTANALSGSASLVFGLSNAGLATLSFANNYTGVTNLNNANATLSLTAAGAISGSLLTYTAGTLKLMVANALSGTAGLTLNGPNLTVSLVNDYSGGTTLSAGTLTLAVDGGLGTGSLTLAGGTFLGSGTGTRTIANATILGAANVIVGGAEDLNFTGGVTLNAAARTLTLNNTGVTTISGPLYLSNAAGTGGVLTIAGNGAVNVSGSIANFNGAGAAGGLTYAGGNVLTLSGTNAYTGATTVNSGTLLLNGAGSIVSSTAVTVRSATLTEDNSSTTSFLTDNGSSTFGRLGNATPVTLQNGKFNLIGNSTPGNSTIEKIGVLTVDAGASVFTLNQDLSAAGTSTMLSADSLVRANRGVAAINGASLGQGDATTNGALLRVATGGTTGLVGGGGSFGSGIDTTISILPWLVGDASATAPKTTSLVGYDTSNNSYRVLQLTEFASATGGSATDNVRYSGNAATIAGATVNSLVLNNNDPTSVAMFTLNGTLMPTSGVVLFSSNGTAFHSAMLNAGTNALLDFGTAEGVITSTITGLAATVGVQIAGSNGVTFSTYNGGNIVLSSTANNYTGPTTVNGLVKLGATGVIPDASDVSISPGGTLDLASFSETIAGLNGSGTVDNSVAGTPVLTIGTGGASGTFSGAIKNSASSLGIVKVGAGIEKLTGFNTYSGSTSVTGGTLEIAGSLSASSLGPISVDTGGTLLLSASNAIKNSTAALSLGTSGPGSTGTLKVNDSLSSATDTFGTLSVGSSSTIDFGAGTGDQLLFAGVGAHTTGAVLSILNWSGSAGVLGTINTDRLIFTGVPANFTYAQSDVFFAGFGSGYMALTISGTQYEIVAIPEPSTTAALLGGVGILGLIGFRRRRSRS